MLNPSCKCNVHFREFLYSVVRYHPAGKYVKHIMHKLIIDLDNSFINKTRIIRLRTVDWHAFALLHSDVLP